MSGVPTSFSRIDLVVDSYFNNAIKDAKRIKRGISMIIIIIIIIIIIVRSMKAKLPSEFSQFLSCGENKNRLIELLFEVIKNKREEVLEMGRCDELLSREGKCKLLAHIEEKTYDQLLSTQEEADIKIFGHAVEILHQDIENKVVTRSPPNDTDILVLSAALLYNFRGGFRVQKKGSDQFL